MSGTSHRSHRGPADPAKSGRSVPHRAHDHLPPSRSVTDCGRLPMRSRSSDRARSARQHVGRAPAPPDTGMPSRRRVGVSSRTGRAREAVERFSERSEACRPLLPVARAEAEVHRSCRLGFTSAPVVLPRSPGSCPAAEKRAVQPSPSVRRTLLGRPGSPPAAPFGVSGSGQLLLGPGTSRGDTLFRAKHAGRSTARDPLRSPALLSETSRIDRPRRPSSPRCSSRRP